MRGRRRFNGLRNGLDFANARAGNEGGGEEGFYLPSFRKLRGYLDFNDISLYLCVFQADSQSTFRVLPRTSGYSKDHEKRRICISSITKTVSRYELIKRRTTAPTVS